MIKAVENIDLQNGERVYSEIKKLLSYPNGGKQLVESSKYGLLTNIFPELKPMKGTTQNEYHHLDVWDHTVLVVLSLENILNNLNKWFNESHIKDMEDWLEKEDRISLLKLSALFHDIAKPKTRSVGKDGRVHFYGHERAGLPIVNNIFERLEAPTKEKNFILNLAKEHLRIKDIATKASYDKKIKFWRTYKEDTFGIVFLFFADLLGKEGPLTKKEKGEEIREIVRNEFLNIWFNDLG